MRSKAITVKPKRRSAGNGSLFYSPAKQTWVARVVDRYGRRITRQRKTREAALIELEILIAKAAVIDHLPYRPPKPKKAPKQQKARMSLTTRVAVLLRDQMRCRMCGRGLNDGIQLEVDHIHPESKGGPTTMDNLQVLCFDCNRGKRDKIIPFI